MLLRWVLVSSLLCAASANAERRFALIVGANDGWATDRSLRFAQEDARRVHHVLTQLGQVNEQDATLLLEPSTKDVEAALSKVEGLLASSSEPTTFFFFYSGHSDSTALHLRGPTMSMVGLADRLAHSKANLTLAVLDSCRSGAILGTKGAVPVAPVRLLADEPVQGFALLSSSGADELAQESKALAGSIFTHHWVSALRGAGDSDGDGVVRLSEAYSYAYERTRADTESTALPQRPGFRFNLKGQGDVALTRLISSAGTVEFEVEASQRYVVVDSTQQRLVAETRSNPKERRRLQLAAGSYCVKRPMPDGVDVAEVTLVPGGVLWATRLAYKREPLDQGLLKGSSTFSEWAASGTLAQGDVSAALSMFQRILDEDPHEARARRGKARALLARSLELQAEEKPREELEALTEALALDPSFGEDPSVVRFAQRAKVLKFEVERERIIKKSLEDEIADTPRLHKHWGLGFLLLSTKGILVLEGHWMPKTWLTASVGVDMLGPGVDLTVKVVPLSSGWSPTVALGVHYGFDAWPRARSAISVNGMQVPLGYNDIWGKMIHADVGLQWMSSGGFAFEFGGGPMLYFNEHTKVFEWFGFANLGMGFYFR